VAAEPRTAGRRRMFAPRRRVSFPELVYAHFLRQSSLVEGRPYEGEEERRYREFEEAFERRHGEIMSAYWATATASGVAVTLKRRPGMFPDHVRLHWATDWATRKTPELDELLYDCEALAVRISEVLRDTSQRVAMQWLFTVIGHVLGFVESDGARDAVKTATLVEAQKAELKRIESYYRKAAVRSGQIVYLGGALLGIMPPIAFALIAWLLGVANTAGGTVRTGFACFAAGAIGALLSVVARMATGRVTVDWEFGKDTLRTMGALRPVVGGIFGLATFFGLKSGVIDLTKVGAGDDRSFFFYVLFSFAAGFSERLAQDMLLGTTLQKLTKKEEEEEPEAGEETPPAAARADLQSAG
jgi:hypothetical protein